MDLTEKTLDSSVVYQGEFLQMRRDRVLLPDQKEAIREYFHHPGAVAILALTDRQELILERQFRYAVGKEFLEIPAGKLDVGEEPLRCAQRELLEETGYRAKEWLCLGTVYPCIGYADETITYFLARTLTLSERQLDEGEFLEVLTRPLQQVIAHSHSGLICDGKTIIGLHWLLGYLRERGAENS